MAMSITVGSGNPGATLIVIPGADLTDGEAWTLVGSAGNESWQVRGGSGTGDGASQVALVDPMCPVNVVVTYTLTVGTTTATDTVTRAYTGEDLILSLDGATVAHVTRTTDGGDPRQSGRRFYASDVSGTSTPPLRLAPVAGAGTGGMVVETDSTNTTALRSLLATNAPLISMHNPENCYDGCTIPLVEIVYVTADRNDVRGRVVTNWRVWDLSYLIASDPEPDYIVPLSTWDEFDAAWSGSTWADFDAWVTANSITWDDFDITDWTTVGA